MDSTGEPEEAKMRATNTIFILSDEHNRDVVGCSGDPVVKTPNLDAMAANGVRFSNAYTNSPVCVPARASLATGRYPHQIGAWDSTMPHDGATKGWAARLVDAGHEVVSIGKLHYRRTEDPNGFSREIVPMHVHNGTGWLTSLLRTPPVMLAGADDMAASIGVGETRYTAYDRKVTRLACDWIAEAAARDHAKPWVLYVGLVAPHFPLIAPQAFHDLYAEDDIPPPRQYAEAERPRHPVLDAMRKWSNYDDYFNDEKVRIARHAYYGLCSFLDDNIGQILQAVSDAGLEEETRIVYTSDHGDNIGHRGLWGKSVMYEDAVALPLLMTGPDLPKGKVVDTPVSLVDMHPTLTAFSGLPRHPDDDDLPGANLVRFCADPDKDRPIFSEYHDWSSITGMFMMRRGPWKLVEYPGYAPQLFNLVDDPHERHDLADNPAHGQVLKDMRSAMAIVGDVDAINARAFADQNAKIEQLGGRTAIQRAPEQAYTPPPQAVLADPLEP